MQKPVTMLLFAQIFFTKKRRSNTGACSYSAVHVHARAHICTQNWLDIQPVWVDVDADVDAGGGPTSIKAAHKRTIIAGYPT